MSVHSDALSNLSCGLDSEMPAPTSSETPKGRAYLQRQKGSKTVTAGATGTAIRDVAYLLVDNTFSTASITVPLPLYKQYLLIFSALSCNC